MTNMVIVQIFLGLPTLGIILLAVSNLIHVDLFEFVQFLWQI